MLKNIAPGIKFLVLYLCQFSNLNPFYFFLGLPLSSKVVYLQPFE